jgi:hypothetical protein
MYFALFFGKAPYFICGVAKHTVKDSTSYILTDPIPFIRQQEHGLGHVQGLLKDLVAGSFFHSGFLADDILFFLSNGMPKTREMQYFNRLFYLCFSDSFLASLEPTPKLETDI